MHLLSFVGVLLPLVTASTQHAFEAPESDAAGIVADQSLIWGTYRPNLYFGMRARLPHSLLTGIMWFGVHNYESYSRTLQFQIARVELPLISCNLNRTSSFLRAGRRTGLLRLHGTRWA